MLVLTHKRAWQSADLLPAVVLFCSCYVLGTSPASADFAAVTEGTVTSGPFGQQMSGVLINFFDPTRAGMANSILQERSGAGYTIQQAGAANRVTLTQLFSFHVVVSNLDPAQPNVVMNVDASAVAGFLAPPILFGPFSVEQRGNNVLPIPIVGPNRGLVAETHAGGVALDQGPVTVADPPVAIPPLPVSLSGGVAAGPTPGGSNAIDEGDRIIAVTFLHEISINGAPFQPYGFLDFEIDNNDMPTLLTDFDIATLVVNPNPFGFDLIGIGSLAIDFPLAFGDNVRVQHTMDAQLRHLFIPEPSVLTLVSAAMLVLLLLTPRNRGGWSHWLLRPRHC